MKVPKESKDTKTIFCSVLSLRSVETTQEKRKTRKKSKRRTKSKDKTISRDYLYLESEA